MCDILSISMVYVIYLNVKHDIYIYFDDRQIEKGYLVDTIFHDTISFQNVGLTNTYVAEFS